MVNVNCAVKLVEYSYFVYGSVAIFEHLPVMAIYESRQFLHIKHGKV